jgi:hypothetical protein
MHAQNAFKRRANGLQHVPYIGQCYANLFGNRPVAALTGLRIDRHHLRGQHWPNQRPCPSYGSEMVPEDHGRAYFSRT